MIPGQRQERTQLKALLDAVQMEVWALGREERSDRRLANRGYSVPSCLSLPHSAACGTRRRAGSMFLADVVEGV